MGLGMSLVGKAMGKVGIPLKVSQLTDKIFEQFFGKDITDFEQFHTAYLGVCKKFNSTMLGQHYEAPDLETIKGYYLEWEKSDDAKRKELLIKNLTKDVKISHTSQSVMTTGLVVPPAAMMLKKTGERVPQIKKFGLEFIPDFLFVPTVTLIALFGVKAMDQKNARSKAVAQ